MRLGLCVPHHRPLATPDLILEAARRGDEEGWDTLWLSDHVLVPNTPEQQHRRVFYEPLALAGHLAAATRRVRIGTSVLVIPYRHPIVTAKQIATVDALSGGRLIVGVGAGGLAEEFAILGVPFHRRGRLTDEYLRVMRELWTSDDPQFAGETVAFDNVSFAPKPAQRPAPPILVGGNSPHAIRRAVELGDGWHPTYLPLDELAAAAGRFRAACAQAGRPATLPVVYRSDVRLLDVPAEPRRQFVGTPDQIAEDLRTCAAAGIDEVCLDFAIPPVESPDAWRAAVDRFTAEVRPQVAAL